MTSGMNPDGSYIKKKLFLVVLNNSLSPSVFITLKYLKIANTDLKNCFARAAFERVLQLPL